MSQPLDLKDFRAEAFNVPEVANKLIKSTLTKQDTVVDVNPAVTRLKYARDELKQTINQHIQTSSSSLLDYANTANKINDEVQNLDPSMQNVTSTYKKLQANFTDPYAQTQKLHASLQNAHKLAQLSRKLSEYLQLALQVQSQEYKRESARVDGSGSASILKNATAVRQIRRLVVERPLLLELDAVKKFERRLPQLADDLRSAAKLLITEFDGMSVNQLRLGSMALLNLKEDLFPIYNEIITVGINSLSAKIAKTAPTIPEFRKTVLEVHNKSGVVATLTSLYYELHKEETDLNKFDQFFKSISTLVDQKLKTMGVVNPQNLQTLKSNRNEILQILKNYPELREVFERYI